MNCTKVWERGKGEGVKKIYKIATARQMKRQDFGKIGVIKDRNGRILQDEEQIKNRWKEYFDTLLNVENERGELEEVAKSRRTDRSNIQRGDKEGNGEDEVRKSRRSI